MKHGDLDFDDAFSHVKQAQQPFMPANVHNQTEALESFTREFIKRYGEYRPNFLKGALKDALQATELFSQGQKAARRLPSL